MLVQSYLNCLKVKCELIPFISLKSKRDISVRKRQKKISTDVNICFSNILLIITCVKSSIYSCDRRDESKDGILVILEGRFVFLLNNKAAGGDPK